MRMEVVDVVEAVVANVICCNQDIMVHVVECVALARLPELAVDGVVAARPHTVLVGGSVEVQQARGGVGEQVSGRPCPRPPEPVFVARLPFQLTLLVLKHVEEHLCMLVNLDVQFHCMAQNDQPHGTLIIDILFQHNLVVPLQNLNDSLHRPHGQTDVGKRIWAVRPDHSAEIMGCEPDPSVDDPGLVHGSLVGQVPAAVGGVAVRPRPAVSLPRDEVWRARPTAVGCQDLQKRLLQQNIVTIREYDYVILSDSSLAQLILQDLLEHQELEGG
mmetsp:Transcript_121365/g.288357  ORF Transcript_121365/g.288357 Transcript_121365/m.288357 type:complete len:273 (-) Transcript_121365:289-1107(-)